MSKYFEESFSNPVTYLEFLSVLTDLGDHFSLNAFRKRLNQRVQVNDIDASKLRAMGEAFIDFSVTHGLLIVGDDGTFTRNSDRLSAQIDLTSSFINQ